MSDFDTTRLVRAMATLAQKTVQRDAGQQEVIVLSKNPDGTVNVDDGSGGCVRVLAFVNARIGDKIRLTKPPLGTDTHEPPNFKDVPPPFNPPEVPPGTCDLQVYSDQVACWGVDSSPGWIGMNIPTDPRVGRPYWGTTESANPSGFSIAELRQTFTPPRTNTFSRVLYRYPRLDGLIADDVAVTAAYIDVRLHGVAGPSPFARVYAHTWIGWGEFQAVQSIDYADIPSSSSPPSPLEKMFFVNYKPFVVAGESGPLSQMHTGAFSVNNRIQLNANGIAALERRKPFVFGFYVGQGPPIAYASGLFDYWAPWIAELPGRHAPKNKGRVLASGGDTPPTRTRLCLTLAQA